MILHRTLILLTFFVAASSQPMEPSQDPTRAPTRRPRRTRVPTGSPSVGPTVAPSDTPSSFPTITGAPTGVGSADRIVFSASSAQDYEGDTVTVRLRYLRAFLSCNTPVDDSSRTCKTDLCSLRVMASPPLFQVNCTLDLPDDFQMIQQRSRAHIIHDVEQDMSVYTETCYEGGSGVYPGNGGSVFFRETVTYSEFNLRCTASLHNSGNQMQEPIFQGYQDVEVDTLNDLLPVMCQLPSLLFRSNWVGYVLTNRDVTVTYTSESPMVVRNGAGISRALTSFESDQHYGEGRWRPHHSMGLWVAGA